MNLEIEKFIVYAIRSDTTNRVYVGQTDDIERRLKEHNSGRVKSTKHETPWKMLAIEFLQDRSEARWCESCLKRSRGKRLKWIDKNKA